jgi:hypothetical protein
VAGEGINATEEARIVLGIAILRTENEKTQNIMTTLNKYIIKN